MNRYRYILATATVPVAIALHQQGAIATTQIISPQANALLSDSVLMASFFFSIFGLVRTPKMAPLDQSKLAFYSVSLAIFSLFLSNGFTPGISIGLLLSIVLAIAVLIRCFLRWRSEQ
ncbi:MAG: hypothetical protein HC852_11240 [Acaryochloridaceae cyanobacterium RU_4_10]|nr:hypothetical protein [Acaryochloridaceae cyanobacterium RU_4_10]